MINIDSRACGTGKTSGKTNSMFHDIKRAYDLGQRVLVVLPSIKIFDEYEKYINSILTDEMDFVSIHTHNGAESTSTRLFNALTDNKRIIVITHKTFQQYQWHSGVKKNIYLLIDEAFDPFKMLEYWEKKQNKVFIDWESVATRSNRGGQYEQLDIDGDALTANVATMSCTLIRDLSDSNWLNHIHHKHAEVLFDIESSDRAVSIIQELDPDIMRHWRSVRIAAARFEITFMSEWLRHHNIDFQTLPDCEFVEHPPLLTVHVPSNEVNRTVNVTNSTGLTRQKDNWLYTAFRAYVESLCIDQKVLTLRNVSTANKDLYSKEQKVDFNAHGQNGFQDFNKISIEAATNLHPDMEQFHKEFHSDNFDTFLARTGYDVYQIVMRSCLRKQPPEPADVYCMDWRIGSKLGVFFDMGHLAENIIPWDVSDYRKQPLTNAQRQKAYRQRQKEKKLALLNQEKP